MGVALQISLGTVACSVKEPIDVYLCKGRLSRIANSRTITFCNNTTHEVKETHMNFAFEL